jgi:hypothetical protein
MRFLNRCGQLSDGGNLEKYLAMVNQLPPEFGSRVRDLLKEGRTSDKHLVRDLFWAHLKALDDVQKRMDRGELPASMWSVKVLLEEKILLIDHQGRSAPAAKPPQPKPTTPEPPKPAAPAQPTNVVEEAKDIIRSSRGARDFLSRATQAGWSKIKEDFIGIYLKKGDATLIFGVLPSHGPDTIWNAMMTTKDTETVYLITEGKIVI